MLNTKAMKRFEFSLIFVISFFFAMSTSSLVVAAPLPKTISCPGGGSYDVDFHGVASNGNSCTGALILDKRVTAVGDLAFDSAPITSLTLDSNLVTIGFASFAHSLQITSLLLNEKLTSIGDAAFQDASFLNSITLNEKLTTIGSWAFKSSSFTTLRLPNALSTIGDGAFTSARLTSLTLGNKLTSIGNYAFTVSRLTSLTLDKKLKHIGFGAFDSAALNCLTNFSNASLINTGLESFSTLPSCKF